LPNQSLAFWLNGTGTIDDVSFLPGYYLVTKYLSNSVNVTLFVSENGIVRTLINDEGGTLTYADDYAVEGNLSDGLLWLNGKINVTMNDDGLIPLSYVDGECYYQRLDSPVRYESCWFPGSAQRSLCDDDGVLNLLNCTYASCQLGTLGQKRVQVFDTSTAKRYDKFGDYFDYCNSSNVIYDRTHGKQVLVMDQKRSICINSTYYSYQGRYDGGSSWATYLGPVACSGTCDSNLTQTITSRDTPLTPPCGSSGTTDLAITNIIPIQVIPDVDMIKGKIGFVVVNVTNKGNNSSKGYVRAWFNGNELPLSERIFSFANINNRTILPGAEAWYVFYFRPETAGNNLIINATIQVVT